MGLSKSNLKLATYFEIASCSCTLYLMKQKHIYFILLSVLKCYTKELRKVVESIAVNH